MVSIPSLLEPESILKLNDATTTERSYVADDLGQSTTPVMDLLPTEILVEIFRYSLDPAHDSSHPYRSTPRGFRRRAVLVCRRWNDIFATHSALRGWKVARVSSEEQWNAALCQADHQGSHPSDVPCGLHANICIGHLRSFAPPPPTDSPSARLKIFRISCNGFSQDVFLSLGAVVSAINACQGDGHQLPEDRKNSHIEEVEIFAKGCIPKISNFPGSLSSLSNLQQLTLKHALIWVPSMYSPTSRPRIELPRLRTLIMQEVPSRCLFFLRILHMPVLENFAFQILDESESAAITGSITALPPLASLHRLALYGISSPNTLTALLTAAQTASEITLRIPQHQATVTRALADIFRGETAPSLASFRLIAPLGLMKHFHDCDWDRRWRCEVRDVYWKALGFSRGKVNVATMVSYAESVDWLKRFVGLREASPKSFSFERVVQQMY